MPSYTSPFTGDVIIPTDVSYAAYTLTTDIQLEWPSNVNTPEYVAARIMNITPDTGSLIMPPANQVSVGQDALIRNLGATSFDVLDYDGNPIVTVEAGKAEYIYVTDNSTTAGVWSVIDFGAGTSGGNANELAGLGLVAISTTLNQSHPTSVLTPNYTFAASDRAQSMAWYGGATDLYLPLAASLGNNWFTIFKNTGTGTVNIFTEVGETLDLQPNKTFAPDESCFIICDGANYYTVGYGQSPNFLFTALVKPISSGDYYLTTQEATSFIQEYVGNLTGDVTVYFPPVVALYCISNQVTPNGYSFTVTTGIPGGATATIPAGNQASLICDGVNFYNANTVQAGGTTISLINGSAAVPSLNFGSEPTTGLYRPGSGELGISILGSNIATVDSGGILVQGYGVFSGGISGGSFN